MKIGEQYFRKTDKSTKSNFTISKTLLVNAKINQLTYFHPFKAKIIRPNDILLTVDGARARKTDQFQHFKPR